MKACDKLKKIIDRIDVLIEKEVTAYSPEFKAWKIKAERFLYKQYGRYGEYGEYCEELDIFCKQNFSARDSDSHDKWVAACAYGLRTAKEIFKVYLEEMQEDSEDNSQLVDKDTNKNIDFKSVFIVHGKDDGLKQSVARIIERQNIRPIILHEQTNGGDTIIEKLEKNSNVGAAICLFTADDLGCERPDEKENKEDKPKLMLRTRQNVVLETGYFMAKLGRKHVIVVAKDEIEIPSDMQGVVYISASSWKLEILEELKAIGYDIDLNKLADKAV